MAVCSPLFALHGFPEEKIDVKHLEKRTNTLQLTIGGMAIIYDLNRDEPNAIREVPALNHLMNCQRYVESGIQIMKIKNRFIDKNDQKLQVIRDVK